MEPDWRKCEAVAAWMANSIQHHAATPTLIQPYPPAANATQDHPATDPPPLPYYQYPICSNLHFTPQPIPQQLPRSQLFFFFGPPWALDILWAKWCWATSPCWEDVALPAAVSGRCRGRQPWWLRADMAEPGRARGDLGQADAGVVAWMIPLSRGGLMVEKSGQMLNISEGDATHLPTRDWLWGLFQWFVGSYQGPMLLSAGTSWALGVTNWAD